MIPLDAYKDKTVAVLGLGKSGGAAAMALAESGAQVLAWDDNEDKRNALTHPKIIIQNLTTINWDSVDRFILSPGIPTSFPEPHPAAQMAVEHHIRPCSDIDLLFEACPQATFIGITGTNGKSTTTALLAHILKKCGQNVQAGGNIGTPALALDPFMKSGVYVLEMSSYQLELGDQHHFNIAACLNITPDHLERHGTLENYVAAKMRIFNRQTKENMAVVGCDDLLCQAIYQGLVQQNAQPAFGISAANAVSGGSYVEADGTLIDDTEHSNAHVTSLADHPTLKGQHNWQNMAAAYQMARLMGETPKKIIAAINAFKGLPHRQEIVRETGNLIFINDSKATNPDSAAKALAAYQNIFWIIGGQAKKQDLAEAEPFFPNVRQAFLIGQDAIMLEKALQHKVPAAQCNDLKSAIQQAVAAANDNAQNNEKSVILLSPACASWDQYENFEARGQHFKDIVGALTLN